jgi:2-oxoglutarate dehydrogenase E1 component
MDMEQFHGPNAGYIAELYDKYRSDPNSVDAQAHELFARWEGRPKTPPPAYPEAEAACSPADVMTIVGAARLARLTREFGHLAARLDPLGSPPPGDPELELATHGLSEQDLERLPSAVIGGPLAADASDALEAYGRLRSVYCGSVGYDFDQVQIAEERDWLRDQIEGEPSGAGDAGGERELLERLTEVETFERFLHRAFPGQKWFSIEGLDMLVPVLDEIIGGAVETRTREVVIGIAHRGRLNVLAHILGQPYETVLGGFMHSAERKRGTAASDSRNDGWAGDVKYHLGATRRLSAGSTSVMPITLVSNPSHLEFVDPVVEGRARAAQESRTHPGPPAQDEHASLAILIHGDAAFPGQGIVAETLNLSRLAGYRTGGTIHIIANNQLGFTTEAREARSTLYAGDLAKGFEIPIVHVNADDPPACLAAARLAHAYRERFRKDFLIDLIGYRRYGHNESDEPAYTQPLMYRRIAQHPTVRRIWASRLIECGVVTEAEERSMVERVRDRLREAQARAVPGDAPETAHAPSFEAQPEQAERLVDPDTLRELNEALLVRPEGFVVSPKLERSFQRRREALEHGLLDWGHAETLAFATILADGVPIRLTGQDTERGTFSQRHLTLFDVETGERYTPLQALGQARASFAVFNSPLSENATLGFEYGYSSHAPGTLVLWEAQYGDFANGAQVIIDQFISSGLAKWRQRCGLVLLLPHGYEGQGPEHSSARLERFLQLAADDNMRIAYPTTSGQYYHLLRRHAALLNVDPRPLVVMTPKSLLRSPRSASTLADLTDVTFQPVLDDPAGRNDAAHVRRVLVCSGKVYTDLVAGEAQPDGGRAPIVRVEELYPFPDARLARALGGYPNLEEVVWVQEEPRNMGAWSYVSPRLQALLSPGVALGYVGRPERASPAVGSVDLHNAEQSRIVRAALAGEPDLRLRGQAKEVAHAG